jgi:hypothetical protein
MHLTIHLIREKKIENHPYKMHNEKIYLCRI